MGSFNNHVDKIRGGGGLTNVHNVHEDYVDTEKGGKNVQICPPKGRMGSKMIKILSTWLLNDPH